MSTFHREERRCSVCGRVSEYMVLGSTNTFGGTPDLDLRPPEMERSTMPLWIHRCQGCGYVSGNVDDPTSVSAEYLASEEYRSCGGMEFKSFLAEAFYQYHMIAIADGNIQSALFALLHAAWSCDDEDDAENAVLCRRQAAALADEVAEAHREDRKAVESLSLMKADIMRRAGLFDAVIRDYSGVSFGTDMMNRILAFEIELAERRDGACYRISDVPEDASDGGGVIE